MYNKKAQHMRLMFYWRLNGKYEDIISNVIVKLYHKRFIWVRFKTLMFPITYCRKKGNVNKSKASTKYEIFLIMFMVIIDKYWKKLINFIGLENNVVNFI